jgi:CRP/FNR family transcriptional regulator, cyclic AMP receptor protein
VMRVDRTTTGGWVRLLDVAPDLGDDLEREALREASVELIAPMAEVQWTTRTGGWGPAEPRGCVGLLIADGLMMREVRLLETASAELLGEGDLLRPWDVDAQAGLPFSGEVRWTVLSPVRVLLLDEAFVRRASRWPEVVAALVGRTVLRAKSLALQDAITNLKHIDTRLLVEFWHLAERWGRVGPGGISLVLPLTHEMLAKLVGATRPSVTTALGSLSQRQLVVRGAEGVWLLSRKIPQVLGPLAPTLTGEPTPKG